MNTLVEARIWAVVLLPEFGLLDVGFRPEQGQCLFSSVNELNCYEVMAH